MSVGFIFPLRYLHWWLGLAIVALGAVAFGLRALERRRHGRLDRFVEAQLVPRLLTGYDARVRRPLFWLTVLGCGFLALTFAQPHWGQAWQEIQRQSHDIVVCLDISESMRAANPLPNRLERAKQKVVSILDRAGGDRFGLVAFSGAAGLQCPLTLDHGYFKAVLNALDTDTISLEGTDIAAALDVAREVFEEESEKTGEYARDTRAIILISDGEAVSGDAVEAAEAVAEYARVYVIGVGDPSGAEVTVPWLTDRAGRAGEGMTHISKLDEDMLERVALAGHGGYIRSTPDNGDIDYVYDYVQQLAAHSVDSDLRLRLVNRYQWPLALAIACFVLEGVWLALLPWLRVWRLRTAAARVGGTQDVA